MWRIKTFIRKIKNLIRWFPIIWKDEDWDSHYIFEILKFKLINQAKCLKTADRYIGVELDVEKIKLCIRLIDKLEDDYYSMEPHTYHKSNYIFDENDDEKETYRLRIEELSEDFDSYFAKYPLEYKRVINAEYCSFNRDTKNGIAYAMGNNIHRKAVRVLFKTLEYNIERWSD